MSSPLDLLIGALGGGMGTAVFNAAISRRKSKAEGSKAEAEAIQAYQAATRAAQEAIAAADEQADQARKRSEGWYQMMQAMRDETDAKIAEVRAESKAELSSLRTQNTQLTAIIASMEQQLSQRTVDQAEVEWAKRRTVEYEAMQAELHQLREDVKEIPHLRAEVARLTTLLEDAQRELRAAGVAIRAELTGGDNSNG